VRQSLELSKAAEYLNVSRRKVWSLVKEGMLQYKQDPLDKRRKLFKLQDLKRLKESSK
jgi:excisionase family DNA binding protein